MNTMMLLEMATQGFGERVAVRSGEAELSYAELFAGAGNAAAEIKAAGIEHVALLDVSSLALPLALFASAWSGRPFVPLNYRLTGDELEALLARISPAYVIADSQRMEALSALSGITVVSRESFLDVCLGPDSGSPTAAPEPTWSMDADDVAVLLFTSGTTGAPKAAVLRHKHLVSYILASVEFGAAAQRDAALVSVPPYHIAGIAAVLSSVYSGRRIVQLPTFSAQRWLEVARNERVTHAFVVPTMLARIVEALGDAHSAELPALRALSYGGGKMPLSVIEKAMALLPATDFANAYGLTETSSTIAVLGPDDHREAVSSDDPEVRRRLVSVGRPLPSIEVEIRDQEGARVEAGVCGEIYVRGEQVSGEYLGRSSSVDGDGWFATRDGGSLDREGYLFVEGRVDDVIVRGGENLSPGEIEDTLLEHHAVADCAVVGVADEHWGESVAAAVVVRGGASVTAEELQEWVKRHLRSSRVPSRIVFRSELPYNETGKLLRRKVKQDLTGARS